ncbi:MAG: aminotransferase class III-fold pyridoxal phosphate-dependent enzyme [Syntrophomonas sp.]
MPEFRRDLLNPTLASKLATFQLDKNYQTAKGSYLTDESGIQYLDFIAQYGAVPFGYNPDFLWNALNELREKNTPSLVQPSLPGEALKLANLLAECSPGDLCFCTFCQSGTEAVEAAIKLARSSTGREIIISTTNSFHGKTLASLSATGKSSYQNPFCAPAPGFVYIPYNDLQALQAIIEEYNDKIAAFIVEPVQGEGGIIVAQPGYLLGAQQICRQNQVLFIVDEIQTGLGRTGALFACDHEKVEPDIMVLSKALGGGLFPLGVCMSTTGVWNDDFGMLHSSTFANNNVTCAIGYAVLQRMLQDDRQLIGEVAGKGIYLLEKMNELHGKFPQVIKEVRGLGLMAGMEFYELNDCGSYDMAYLADQGGFTTLLAGFLLNVYHIRVAPYLNNSMTLRLEPTLTITYEEIDRVMKTLEVICQIMDRQDYAQLYRYLIGDYSQTDKIEDYRHLSRTVKCALPALQKKAASKFAFIIHYPAPEDVIHNNPSFSQFNRSELYQFMAWQSSLDEPGVCCHMPAIRSLNGEMAEGWMIGIPYGARELMTLPRETTVEVIKKAVDRGHELGAGIIGLGALTSVVTRGGRAVLDRDVAITSGNSFTTLMAMEALFAGARKMHIDMKNAWGAVVGATGSIGRACALLLSEQLSRITLLGNPDHFNSSHRRLNSLASEIIKLAFQRRDAGIMSGLASWLDKLFNDLEKNRALLSEKLNEKLLQHEGISLDDLEIICMELGIDCPLKISLDIPATLPNCDMIVAASSSPEYIIYPQHLQPGTVVCDVARPADVAPEVYKQRDDVLILEGGLVQYPEPVAFGPNLGYRDGVNLACLSETVLLALEGDFQDYSIGSKLSLETLEYMRMLGQKHGFGLAGLMMNDREIADEEIEKIYQNSLHLKRVQNL